MTPSPREGLLLHPYLPLYRSQQGDRHYLEMLCLIYLTSRWQKATVAQSWLENSASDSPCSPSLQGCAGTASHSFSLCQYHLAFNSVSLLFSMELPLPWLPFPRPHFFRTDSWSFHGLKALCQPVHPDGGKKRELEGRERKPSPLFSWCEQIQFHAIPAKGSAHNKEWQYHYIPSMFT